MKKTKQPSSSFLPYIVLLLWGTQLALSQGDFLQCLTLHSQNSTSISQVIYTPNNSSYTSILQSEIYNLRFASPSTPKPLAIVTPVSESQIQTVIFCAKKHGIEIRTRSGGHDFEGLSYVSRVSFVLLDLFNLNGITIDVQSATAWVQAGASLGQLYYTIAEKSQTLGFPAGVSSALGVGGHFSGGGYGAMMRKHGLAADNVIDTRFADAHGRILNRFLMGEDLFWAIRGGGGSSFGVILSWKIKLVPVPDIVTYFSVDRTLEQNATQIVHKWQSVAPKIDKDLEIRILMFSVVNPSTGNRTIRATFETLFLGGINRLIPLMQEKFPELGLVSGDCTEMSWIQSVLVGGGFINGEPVEILLNRSVTPRAPVKGKSDYVTVPISQMGLKGIWEFYNDRVEEQQALLVFTPYGGRMDEIPESAIPFPHRNGTLFMVEYLVIWDGDEMGPHISWIRSLYDYMTTYVSKSPRRSYLNYNDLDLGVGTSFIQARSTWGASYFSSNFNRLVRVKSIADPGNFFKREQSIPTFITP